MKLRVRKYRILEIMDAKGIDSIKDLGEQLDIAPTNISSLPLLINSILKLRF